MTLKQRVLVLVAISASCVACDQETKHLADLALKDKPPIEFLDHTIKLMHAQNLGAWGSLGAITSHEREHLGFTDRGISLLRRRLKKEIEALAQGVEPVAPRPLEGVGVQADEHLGKAGEVVGGKGGEARRCGAGHGLGSVGEAPCASAGG